MSIGGRNRRRLTNQDSVELDDLPEFLDVETENKARQEAIPEKYVDCAPPEIQDFLAECNIGSSFLFYVYKVMPNGKSVLQTKLDSEILDESEVGKRFGSGEYRCQLQWKYTGSQGESKKGTKFFNWSLGVEFDLAHAEYKKEHYSRIGALSGNNIPPPPAIDPIVALKALAELVPKPAPIPAQSSDNTILVTMMTNMMQMFMKMQDDSSRRLEKVLEKIGENKEDDIMSTITKFKALREIFPEPTPEGGDKLDRLIDGGFELIKTLGPSLIQKANTPVIGGIVRNQIAHDPRWQQLLADPETREQALDHLYASTPKEEVDKFLHSMNVSEFIR